MQEVEEDAAQLEREEVRAQQAVAVHDATQRLADAAGRCEVARREAAEDVRHRVVRQRRGLAHRRPQIRRLGEKRDGRGRWQTTRTEPKGSSGQQGGGARAADGELRSRAGDR